MLDFNDRSIIIYIIIIYIIILLAIRNRIFPSVILVSFTMENCWYFCAFKHAAYRNTRRK